METNYAEEQASAQYQGIVDMLAALECDYDRLEEMRDEIGGLTCALSDCDELPVGEQDAAREAAQAAIDAWDAENNAEFQTLIAEAGDCTSRDDAAERIQEDPLEIQVRSGWANLGDSLNPEEFQILLCTGGPAVRIRGELDQHREPCRAWLEYQDWGTPWTQYFDASQDTLLQYCQQFYFGE